MEGDQHQPNLGLILPHMVVLFDKKVSRQSSKTQRWDCSASRCGLPGSQEKHMSVWTPSITLLQHATHHCNSLSFFADVVWLWNSECVCVLSMMSVRLCYIWKRVQCSACKRACVLVRFNGWLTVELLVICPGTHKNHGKVLCVTPCAFTGLSAMYTTCRKQEECFLFIRCIFKKRELGHTHLIKHLSTNPV